MMRSREKRWGAQKTTVGKHNLLQPHAPPVPGCFPKLSCIQSITPVSPTP